MTAEVAWYAAKCIFQHFGLAEDESNNVFEERIVLVRAGCFDDAIAAGEAEAHAYAAGLPGVSYVGYIMIYRLFDTVPVEGTEVYSLMRTSPLDAESFVTRYFDDGTQHAQG